MASEILAQCLDCGHEEPYSPLATACSRCGSEWRTARYPYKDLARTLPIHLAQRPFDLWRYSDLLPVRSPHPEISMGEGGTPLLPALNLGTMLGLQHLYIKDERQGPTSSFKDRQAAVTIAALKEAGITEMVVASTGNVAIAYAAYAARAGIKLWAFLTSSVPAEKMREVAIYGAQVVKVTGSYDQTKQVAAEFARLRGLYLDKGARSIPTVEAMKTIAFEIVEQITALYGPPPRSGVLWRAPDWYLQSVSGGLGPLGISKAFEELHLMGLIDRIPKMGLIQTAGCAPMVHAWQQGREVSTPVEVPLTHITTLATGDPGRTYTLLYHQLRRHGGTFLAVSDEEAFQAMHDLAKMEGLSVEPATGVAFAGLAHLVRGRHIASDEIVVVNATGHTMPVESHILGERWAKHVVLRQRTPEAPPPREGLLAALSHLSARRYPRVLIVDDHAPARLLLRRVLQSLGEYELHEAENGRQALQLARDLHPNLIILDLMMPEMDGFSVLEALKEDPHTAEIPVIVVTAKTLTPQERQRLKGIQSLLQKGEFLSEEFMDEIRQLLG